jgi:hypothetical protein
MAVYTDVNEDQLRAFLAEYDVGTLLSYKGIAEGVENSNFLLRTSGGTFILTLYEKRVNRDDLPFFLGLMDHLALNGPELSAADLSAAMAVIWENSPAARLPWSRSLTAPGCASRRPPIAVRSAGRWPRCMLPAATSRSAAPTG